MLEIETLDQLNAASKQDFVETLGAIFEHSPWVAEAVYAQRPFSSVAHLHRAMFTVVKDSSDQVRHQLICNHPELAGKEATQGTLTADSKDEQASAGLDQCSPEEFRHLNQLNVSYKEKFGFPFIIAVRGRNRYQIMEDMASRIENDPNTEFARCIDEIGRIAELRLNALFIE